MIPYPHIDPIALEVGPFHLFGRELGPIEVHWYGIMYLVGFAAGWWLGRYRASRRGSTWSPVDVDDFVFFAMLGVILGGRIGYVLFYGLTFWKADPWYPIKIWDGGMSFHGGLVGVMVAVSIFALRRGRSIGDVLDFAAPLPAVGLFAGRIGNFINGELWGKATTLPWGFDVNGVVRQPSQLYEAALEGVVLFIVMWLYTSRPRPRLAPSGLFLLIYGVSRFLVEFVRMPDPQLGYLWDGWLTMGQVLSMPMFLIGAALIYFAYHRRVPSGNWALAS
jgi:phosphatidylglycerol---prolipoprotein diacylglyceryl transferase